MAIDWRATPSHAIGTPSRQPGGGRGQGAGGRGPQPGSEVTVTLTVESHYLCPRSFHQSPLTNEISSRPTVSGHVPDRVRSNMLGGGSTGRKGKGLAKRGRHGGMRSSVFLEGYL